MCFDLPPPSFFLVSPYSAAHWQHARGGHHSNAFIHMINVKLLGGDVVSLAALLELASVMISGSNAIFLIRHHWKIVMSLCLLELYRTC